MATDWRKRTRSGATTAGATRPPSKPGCDSSAGENVGRPVRGSVLTRTRRVPARDELIVLARVLPCLGEALGALHDRGLAHRALSPGTILMPGPGTVLLRDLGLAAVPPRVGERDDPHHAPEQATGTTPPGPPADVHRVARILYELISGRPAGRRGRQVAPSVLNKAVPAACDEMFRRALDANPGRRPGVRAFAAGLRTAIEAPGNARPSRQA